MTQLPTVPAGEVMPGDLLYVAADLITVGRVAPRRASRIAPRRVAIYPLRVDTHGQATVEPCAACCWPLDKPVRLDPASPRYKDQSWTHA